MQSPTAYVEGLVVTWENSQENNFRVLFLLAIIFWIGLHNAECK